MSELRLKTEAHKVWGLGSFETWSFHQDAGRLVFTDPVHGRAEAPAQIVATYNADERTWLWGWANPSIVEALTADSRTVKAFGEARRYDELTQPSRTATMDDAWRMAALAMRLAKRQGVYRGPAADNLFVFFTFGDVQLTKAGAASPTPAAPSAPPSP
jgi:hypothetical protein